MICMIMPTLLVHRISAQSYVGYLLMVAHLIFFNGVQLSYHHLLKPREWSFSYYWRLAGHIRKMCRINSSSNRNNSSSTSSSSIILLMLLLLSSFSICFTYPVIIIHLLQINLILGCNSTLILSFYNLHNFSFNINFKIFYEIGYKDHIRYTILRLCGVKERPPTWYPFIQAFGFLRQVLKNCTLLKSSRSVMLPFPAILPAFLSPVTASHTSSVMAISTPLSCKYITS